MKFSSFIVENELFLSKSATSKITKAIKSIGGNVWVIGGSVRDKFMSKSMKSKDVDLVVTDLSISDPDVALQKIMEVLEPISKKIGLHGESFGVIKAIIDGEDLDIAIPRAQETKTGEGHADFNVELDPTASIETDLSRRDFTINAIAQSLFGDKIVDPFNGRQDIKDQIIRTVGNPQDRFSEDPLRMLRAIQFASRFNFTIEPSTLEAIHQNVEKITSVSGERIFEEIKKAFLKGKADSEKLNNLLIDTGIGKKIFGDSFNPITVNVHGDHAVPARFIGLFLRGGDPTKAKPTKELLDHLHLAKEVFTIESDSAWKVVKNQKQKDMLVAIHTFFDSVKGFEKETKLVEKMIETPILPTELELRGGDLNELGIQGKKIGEAQKLMLHAIWNGLENDKEVLLDFLQKKEII